MADKTPQLSRVVTMLSRADIMMPLADALTGAGYRVRTRVDDEAVERLTELPVQAIIFENDPADERGSLFCVQQFAAICRDARHVTFFPVAATIEMMRATIQHVIARLETPPDMADIWLIPTRILERFNLRCPKNAAQELALVDARLNAIVEATKNLAACSGLQELGRQLLELFARHMAAEGGSLYLKEQSRLRLIHAIDPGHAPPEISFPLKAGSLFQRVIQEKRPLMIQDVAHEAQTTPSGWAGYRNGSLLLLPLMDEQGDVLALMTIHNKAYPPFTAEDMKIGVILARHSYEMLRATLANQQLQESEARYRLIFENIHDIYYETSIEGTILEISPSITAQSQYQREELLGTPVSRLYALATQRQHLLDELRARGSVLDYEVLLKNKDETVVPCSISAKIWVDAQGTPVKICGMIRNISARKQMENALLRMNEDLERLVSARTSELQRANQELRDALETLNATQTHLAQSEKMAILGSLVAGVTHEMNTPLGMAVTAASHLDGQLREIVRLYRDAKMTRSAFEHFLEQAQRMVESLQTNLSSAIQHAQSFKQMAVDQTGGQTRRFRLAACIHDVLLSLSPRLKRTAYRVEVHCPDTLELQSYPGAFSQILTNLIMNALIHGFEGRADGDITIDAAQEADAVALRCRDNGNGMTPQEQARIFEPFYTTKRNQGGSGLGLAIVRHVVVEQLRGEITCDSAPQQGATFTIRVPLASEELPITT